MDTRPTEKLVMTQKCSHFIKNSTLIISWEIICNMEAGFVGELPEKTVADINMRNSIASICVFVKFQCTRSRQRYISYVLQSRDTHLGWD